MANSVRWSLFMWGVISVRAQSQVITPGVTPLWPCYSAYKLSPSPIQLEFNYSDTPLPTSYVAWYHRSPGWNTVPVTQCAFVIEAPVNYTLLLQLHQVEFADSSGNCSASAVRIYNYNTRGDLVLVNATCESSVLGLPVSTDTNTALVTTFLGRGQFGLRVTIVAREGTLDMTGQGNNTRGSTQGSTQGNTQGSTQGNTQGSTQGNTQGNTQGSTQGNTQGTTQNNTQGPPRTTPKATPRARESLLILERSLTRRGTRYLQERRREQAIFRTFRTRGRERDLFRTRGGVRDISRTRGGGTRYLQDLQEKRRGRNIFRSGAELGWTKRVRLSTCESGPELDEGSRHTIWLKPASVA